MELPLMITSRDKAHKTMQDILLEGLKEIDRICRKHDIKYSLGGGTCLGQVRHGGFIPWDDDIDLDMTVENYEKFLEVAKTELDTSRFYLYTRENQPTLYRSFSRLGILDTQVSVPKWEKAGKVCNVYIDIMRCSYMPDDKEARRKLSTKLFLIRCIEHYKELGEFANKLEPKYKLLVELVSTLVPIKLIQKYEEHLIKSVKGRTGWMLDDSIAHGAYEGYPSEGVDEYVDVQFEGITVMNKKDPHTFLTYLYGENYGEWLPPAKRISHHNWTQCDLGHFAAEHGLDDSYKDFMSIKYSESKLRQMKLVNDYIIDKITRICQEHNIKYTVAKLNETGVNRDLIDIDNLWTRPGIIMMMRDEYEKFAEICAEDFGNQFEYQSHENDPDYYYDYARVHLNYTKIRDRHIRFVIEKGMNSGFFVKIIPLDNYGEDANTKEVVKKLRFWRRIMYVKWRTTDFVYFKKLSFKDKVKLIMKSGVSLDKMYARVKQYATMYNNEDCKKVYDSSHQLDGIKFKKSVIENSREIEIERSSLVADSMAKILKSVDRHYGPCYLTYYDAPDRQLSILRYDEKSDRLLSNEEVVNMK